VIPARTRCAPRACFHESTCGISTRVSMLRMCQRTSRTSLRSHSTCHSQLVCVLPLSDRSYLTRSRHKRFLWSFRSAVSRRPCRAPFYRFFLRSCLVDFFVIFRPLEQLFRHQHHHQRVVSIVSSSKFVANTP
jgi:hypothetical protein